MLCSKLPVGRGWLGRLGRDELHHTVSLVVALHGWKAIPAGSLI